MKTVLDHLPVLKGVFREEIRLDQPFEQIAAAFADDPGTVVLLSGADIDCARYHILAAKPWLDVTSRPGEIVVQYNDQTHRIQGDLFDFLQALLNRFSFDSFGDGLPVCAGLFGYLAYDLKNRIEALPVTCMDTFLPDLCLYAPSVILIQDQQTGKTHLCIPEFFQGSDEKSFQKSPSHIQAFFWDKISTSAKQGSFCLADQELTSCFTRSEYIASVRKIIAYLKAGDIYQANLSQRFEAGFQGDAYALFLELFRRNPAPFFSYVRAADHTIVSSSPERFIRQTGRDVETRPIKGTIARGTIQTADFQNRAILEQSAKDDAELTMIVDLMRNDLSRVTVHGSVVVSEHKRIEPYENVFHMVSVVNGTLAADKTAVDLIKATFPGGSITGCPKIRAMEIIDELEPVKRHVYTGSIGYISFHDTMDLSIAIRTATIVGNRIFFSVGGGIVYDSDPEREYQETLDKGKTLMETLSGQEICVRKNSVKAWVNGRIVDQNQARVPAASPGFQYGAGVFETIRVDRGRVFRLTAHVARMSAAWKALFNEAFPDITWKAVIDQLIGANQFQDTGAAVKLLVAKDGTAAGSPYFLAAFARRYTHRLDLLGKTGLDLVTFPEPRQSPLADYKTLNYLYYDQARRFAAAHHADEALILNVDGTVSETNTANLFAVTGRTVRVPASVHVLGGVMLSSVLTMLADQGYDIQVMPIKREAICHLPNVMATNALMGVVKVLSIDGHLITHSEDVCTMINAQLFDQ